MSTPSRRAFLAIALLGLSAACNDGATPPPTTPGAAAGPVKVGDAAPALDAERIGAKGRVRIPKGKVVLVDFWATWCGPCKESFPAYQDLYVKYKASGLEILAVSADEPEEKASIPAWLKGRGREATFTVGWDDSRTAPKRWGVKVMPTAFLVDKQGVVRHVHEKFEGDADIQALEKQIKQLL